MLQSGAPAALPPAEAAHATTAIAQHLGIAPTAHAFAQTDRGQLLAAQRAFTRGGNPLTGTGGFHLAIDGDVVPQAPATALADGASDHIDVLVGTTTDEYRLWFVPSGLVDQLDTAALQAALSTQGAPPQTLDVYQAARPGASPGEIYGAIATDRLLRIPLNRLADARVDRPGRTFFYEFAWPSPVQDLDACHALEIGFVFDTLDAADGQLLTGPNPPQHLAEAMHTAWVAFATDGDPGWPQWSEDRPVMTFGADGAAVVPAPREQERRLWP